MSKCKICGKEGFHKLSCTNNTSLLKVMVDLQERYDNDFLKMQELMSKEASVVTEEDLKKMSKDKQKQALIDMMQADENDGLYNIPNSKQAFNEKYKDYLEPRFYGLEIGDPDVIYYLDQEFEKEIKQNPTFQYSQIKLKFGRTVIYCNKGLDAVGEWEDKIDEILLVNKQ